MSDFINFHKVEDMHFDIPKLKKSLEEVLNIIGLEVFLVRV